MMQTNCHNCGAVITGPTCEYCGTRFNIKVVDVVDVDFREESIVSFAAALQASTITTNEARRLFGYREL